MAAWSCVTRSGLLYNSHDGPGFEPCQLPLFIIPGEVWAKMELSSNLKEHPKGVKKNKKYMYTLTFTCC